MKPEPFSDSELDQLQDCQMVKSDLENTMVIAMLDGYLTAVVSGPRTIRPSEWLPRVWDVVDGGNTPRVRSVLIE
ncbi:MAG: UPF0149 family protein [Gammaproteobacteria bacterium]|nr:UPF0149 family protein [Gammaproteobacteria bacterium]